MKVKRMPTAPLDLALRYGMLTPAQVETWRRAGKPEAGEAVVERLVTEGYLDPDEAGILRSLLAAPEAEAVASPTVSTTVRQAHASTPDPRADVPTVAFAEAPLAAPATIGSRNSTPTLLPRPFGKYQLVAELGRGGMGVVYKAWHPGLKTHFAVKVLLAGSFSSAEEEDRFRREAQLSARLKHPGIVAVYDIGVEEGKSYFAMEFVEGVSLHQVLEDPARYGFTPAPAMPGAAPSLLPAIAIRMTQEIALAVQAAHEAGVVHRDLKPANVLRRPDGSLKVADFGLARALDAGRTGATATGALLGTPEYMSPEQAEGRVRDVDARSDVYQMGAILYELMTGEPPYTAPSVMQLIEKVRYEDPRPPHQSHPRIDRDAETICLKALARQPLHRYASARELADDCARYLAGEAIRARREAPWERWLRRARRNKGLAVLGTAAILLFAAFAVMAVQRAGAQREAAAARAVQEDLRRRTLEALRRDAATQVQATIFVRRSGARVAEAGKQFLPALEAAAREVMAQAPDLAEPHYHLGRLQRALMHWDAALAEQDRALAKDPDFAPSLYERAILRSRLLRDRTMKLFHCWEISEGLRLQASGGLARGRPDEAGTVARPTTEELFQGDADTRALGEALAADLAHLARLPRSPAAAPSLAPALTPAMLDCADGLRIACGTKDPELLRRAQTALERAIAADPSLEEAYEGLARIAAVQGDLLRAVEACTAGLAADKGYVPFRIERGESRFGLAERLLPDAAASAETFALADADIAAALELDPTAREALVRRGEALSRRGLFVAGRGEDPVPLYRRGEEDLTRAIQMDPQDVAAVRARGTLRVNWGLHEHLHGGDPSPRYHAADEDLSLAVAAEPQSADPLAYRGLLRTNWAAWRRSRGEDPGAQLRGAEADLGKALELNPTWDRMWIRRGEVRLTLALCLNSRGEDPAEAFDAATADFGQAIRIDPQNAEAWMRRALVNLNHGFFREALGADPEAQFRDAEADDAKALELDANSASAWFVRGVIRVAQGQRRRYSGGDADPAFAGAEQDLSKAVELNPGFADAWRWRGLERARRAATRECGGSDFAQLRRDAETDIAKALALNPADADSSAARGELRADQGLSAWCRGTDPGEWFRGAEADYGAAADRNPSSTEAWIGRGNVRTWWGLWKKARGQDSTALWEGALADYGQALKLNPQDAEPWARRARLHEACGARAEARVDFDAAVQRNPTLKDRLRDTDAELRVGDSVDPATHLERACALAAAAGQAATLDLRADLRERAFGHLRAAVDSGGIDATALDGEARLQGLRGDPRWPGKAPH